MSFHHLVYVYTATIKSDQCNEDVGYEKLVRWKCIYGIEYADSKSAKKKVLTFSGSIFYRLSLCMHDDNLILIIIENTELSCLHYSS